MQPQEQRRKYQREYRKRPEVKVKRKEEYKKYNGKSYRQRSDIKKYMQTYYQNHKSKIIKQSQLRTKINSKQIKAQRHQYYLEHKEEMLKKKKQRYQTDKKLQKQYRLTHKKQYKESYKKHFTKRTRGLGFIPFNELFENSVGHHIDFECVVYIPKELHNSVHHNVWTGRGMAEINDKAFEWLIEHGDAKETLISHDEMIVNQVIKK